MSHTVERYLATRPMRAFLLPESFAHAVVVEGAGKKAVIHEVAILEEAFGAMQVTAQDSSHTQFNLVDGRYSIVISATEQRKSPLVICSLGAIAARNDVTRVMDQAALFVEAIQLQQLPRPIPV